MSFFILSYYFWTMNLLFQFRIWAWYSCKNYSYIEKKAQYDTLVKKIWNRIYHMINFMSSIHQLTSFNWNTRPARILPIISGVPPSSRISISFKYLWWFLVTWKHLIMSTRKRENIDPYNTLNTSIF